MVGITSYGAYIPFNRLQRKTLAEAYKGPAGTGEKAVANYDEDSVTMAVEAAVDCLNGMDRTKIDAVYLATTTPAYQEKLSAAIIAAALNLKEELRSCDLTDSLRASSSAMLAAVDAVKGGCEKVLVCAADCRIGAVKSGFEQNLGDGAAAFTFGKDKVLASVEATFSVSADFNGTSRQHDADFIDTWDERFLVTQGYNPFVKHAVEGVLAKAQVTPGQISKLVLYAPSPRYQTALGAEMGFGKGQIEDCLYQNVGNAGTGSIGLMLVGALEKAQPGDLILVAMFSEGSDAIILKVTEEINNFKPLRGLSGYLTSSKNTMSYLTYLTWRDLVTVDVGQFRAPSVSALWRSRKKNVSFIGSQCRACGAKQYPPQRVCFNCRTQDEMDDCEFSDKKATVVTYTFDFLYNSPDPPTAFVAVDFEGGGRQFLIMTDCEMGKLAVGTQVEPTFRKYMDVDGIISYLWKGRLVR